MNSWIAVDAAPLRAHRFNQCGAKRRDNANHQLPTTNYQLTKETMFKVRLFTYVLFLVLYALLGVMTVNERSACTAMRYRLAKELKAERRLDESLARQASALADLQSPARLERLNAELNLRLEPLRTSGAIQEIKYR
ncbi:MAG: hypothetical protein J6333_07990 [Planctomycetes bacterium]|nr:hypothetical protein [Planctomycetota bacterium]